MLRYIFLAFTQKLFFFPIKLEDKLKEHGSGLPIDGLFSLLTNYNACQVNSGKPVSYTFVVCFCFIHSATTDLMLKGFEINTQVYYFRLNENSFVSSVLKQSSFVIILILVHGPGAS